LADSLLIILLALHIGFIALWAGAAVVISSIIIPSLGKISPGSRAEFIIATLPLLARFVAAVSTGAVLAGVVLFGYETRIAPSLAPSSLGTIFIEAGAVVGLIAYVLAIGVAFPTANRLVKMLKQPKEGEKTESSVPPEIPRLQARMRMTAGAVSGLLGITLVLMVIGAVV
jgi:hypothetical protein